MDDIGHLRFSLALFLLTFAVFAGAAGAVGDDSEAANWGTSSSPLSSLSMTALSISQSVPLEVYVENGGSVSILGSFEEEDGVGRSRIIPQSVTSGFGLSVSSYTVSGYDVKKVTGTLSRTGDCTITLRNIDEDLGEISDADYTTELIIHSVGGSTSTTPVTSVSISGSTSVAKGSSISLSASVYPSNATDGSVTWSIYSGSSYVSISSSGKSCTVTGKAAGTATIKCTANDGSGKYATKSITVSSPTYLYNLYFDMNGGTGGPDYMQKSATDSTSTLSFTIPSETPTKSGCTFLGWSASSTATSASYQPGDTVSVTYDDKTLYAVWQENKQTYYAYLYYNANSGSGAPSTQSASIYASSASGSKSFTVSSTQPTRSGYDFLGWSTSSAATSASYQSGSSVSVPYGSSKTLYAVWQQKSYTSALYFDANEGSGAPSTQTDTHTSTSAHTFTIPTTQPTRSGFTFLGWSESSTAASASYQPGGTVSVSYNGSKTLYAVWQAAELEITSEPATGSLKVGQPWSYAPTTNVDGCTVSVSGADWLSVSDGTIAGAPTSAGTYDVTVTVSKSGYASDTQSIVLKVYSTLGFNSNPSAAGVFVYAE